MIKKQSKEINYIDFSRYNFKKNNAFDELIITNSDIIINCSKIIPNESLLIKLDNHQKKITKSLVVIIPPNMQNTFVNNFNFVPTKKEAYDFVYFEQLQRDLGY